MGEGRVEERWINHEQKICGELNYHALENAAVECQRSDQQAFVTLVMLPKYWRKKRVPQNKTLSLN
jgi:hypothetical protein